MPDESPDNMLLQPILDFSANTREEVLGYLPDLFVVLTVDGTVRTVSQAALKLLRLSPERVIGSHFNHLPRLQEPCPWKPDFAQLMESGQGGFDLYARCRDGEIMPIGFRLYVIRDDQARPSSVLAMSSAGDAADILLRETKAQTADRVSRMAALHSSIEVLWPPLLALLREVCHVSDGWLQLETPHGAQHISHSFGRFRAAKPPHQADPEETNLPHLSIPIPKNNDEPWGFLCLFAPPGQPFHVHELRLIETVADQIGQALDRGEIHLSPQSLLLSGHALARGNSNASDLVALMEMILHNLFTLVPFVSAGTFLCEEGGLRLTAVVNPPTDEVRGHLFTPPYAEIPIIAEIVRTRSQVILDDVRQDARFCVWEDYDYIRGWMGLPLISNDAAIGVITVDSDRVGGFGQREGEIAQAFADQAAIAIENMQLAADLRMEKAYLELLYQISQSLAETLDPAAVANKALDLITETLPNSFGEIYVVKSDQEFLQLLATKNLLPHVVANLPNQPYLRIGVGITGGVVETRRPILSPNVRADPRFVQIPGLGIEIESLVAIPLIARDEVTGVLVLGSTERGVLTHDHLPLFQSIAAPVALALQNARFFAAERRRRQEADMLRNAASAVTLELGLEQILLLLLERLRQVVAFDSACVFLREGTDLRALAEIGLPVPNVVGHRFPLNNSFFSTIQREQRAIFFDDVQKLPRFSGWGGTSTIHGWMGVPLIHRGNMLGYITLDSLQVGSFGQEEASLAQAFADQMAITIVNAHLVGESQRAEVEQRGISAMLRGLNSALSLSEMHTAVADALHRLLQPAVVETALYEHEEGLAHTEYSYWLADDETRSGSSSYRMDESVVIPTVLEDQVYITPDNQEMQRAVEKEWMARGCRFHMALPLAGSDRILGHLRLVWGDGVPPRQSVGSALRQAADGLAMAAERLNLLHQITRRADDLQALRHISEKLRGVLQRSEITQIILSICRERFSADRGYIFVPTEDGKKLVLIDHVGKEPNSSILSLNLDDSINGRVFRSGVPYFSPNLFVDPLSSQATVRAWFEKGVNFASTMYAPLRAGEEIVGVISLTYVESRRSFNQEDIRLLAAMSEIAGNALHRATILEGLEQRVEERTADLAQANARLMELDQMKSDFVANVSHELRTPLTNIKLYLDLLRNGRTDRREHYLQVMEAETAKLHALIESILDLSALDENRSDATLSEVIFLHEVMESNFRRFQEQANAADISLAYLPAGQQLTVLGNPERLAQAIGQLVKNAIAYTRPGGAIDLHLVQNAQGEAGIVVRDTGIGISADEIDQIFERFYRSQQVRNSSILGTGLGLSIVNQIVQAHAGRIEVESVVNVGTTFTIWLPIHNT